MISFVIGTIHQMLFGPKKINRNMIVGVCSTCGGGERRSVYRVLVGKFEGKRPIGRSRLRREGNIKIDLKCDGGTWNRLNWLRMRTAVGLL
jgi:hypothetical protein